MGILTTLIQIVAAFLLPPLAVFLVRRPGIRESGARKRLPPARPPQP